MHSSVLHSSLNIAVNIIMHIDGNPDWATPAYQDSRRFFSAGEVIPTFEHFAYGAMIREGSDEQQEA